MHLKNTAKGIVCRRRLRAVPRQGTRLSRMPRQGLAGAWVVVSMVALMGAAAMVFDVGRLAIAAQRAQDVADSAALAGAPKLPYSYTARQIALATVQVNNTEGTGWQVQCGSADVIYYGPNQTLAEGVVLGPWACALKVTTRAPVDYGFARVLGINGATARRSAIVIRGPVAGVPICPMWIAYDTPLTFGLSQEMHMADSPHYAGIPGSFGWLSPPPGCTVPFFDLLRGYGDGFPLTIEQVESSYVNVGSTVWAQTGESVGNFEKALDSFGGGPGWSAPPTPTVSGQVIASRPIRASSRRPIRMTIRASCWYRS